MTSLHSLRHGDQCREDQADDKQHQWHQHRDKKKNGQKHETVTSFKYLGSIITDKGSKPEILSRIAQTTAALTSLKLVWNDRECFSQFQNTTDAFPCHIRLPVCLLIIDPHSRAPQKVPTGSSSRGGDVTVYVFNINQPSLPTPFTLFLCLFLSFWPFQLYFTP